MRRSRRPAKKQANRPSYTAGAFVLGVAATLIALNSVALYVLQLPTPVTQAVAPPPEPKDYLAMRCQEPQCDFDLLERIAFCESSWRMIKNDHSSAFGFFQIIDATERGTPQYAEGRRKYDPYANIDMGIYLYQRYGTSPWNESRRCWGWWGANNRGQVAEGGGQTEPEEISPETNEPAQGETLNGDEALTAVDANEATAAEATSASSTEPR